MPVPLRHLMHQGPVIGGLLRVGVSALAKRGGEVPRTPGPTLQETAPPRPRALVEDYLRWLGTDPARYENVVPPHLFPQWGFPLLGRTLESLPYPLTKVLNQGCRLTVKAPLPADQPLHLEARLVEVREEPGKARIHQQLITGTEASPAAVIADVFAVVPLPRKDAGERTERARPSLPEEAEPVAERRFDSRAGRDFALLTGDFNPIHWIPLAARAGGFKHCILHGFATLAWSWERLGESHPLEQVDVRFTRPLTLPATVGLFRSPADDGAIGFGVGEAPGGPAWMLGTAS